MKNLGDKANENYKKIIITCYNYVYEYFFFKGNLLKRKKFKARL